MENKKGHASSTKLFKHQINCDLR